MVTKMRRSERVAAIVKQLVDHPHGLLSLADFEQQFGAAKSMISEDLSIIREALAELELGDVQTVPGVGGGVRFSVKLSAERRHQRVEELCRELSHPDRILPGGFIYMTDIIFSPRWASKIGEIFASQFVNQEVQAVVTVETKGIPLALMTARWLDVPLVTIRRNSRVTEGSAMSINYVSGSSQRIQSMSLARRTIQEGSRVVIVDDFMRGGGTAQGMQAMMKEFNTQVVGVAVLAATREPEKKLVQDYESLLVVNEVDRQAGKIDIQPARS